METTEVSVPYKAGQYFNSRRMSRAPVPLQDHTKQRSQNLSIGHRMGVRSSRGDSEILSMSARAAPISEAASASATCNPALRASSATVLPVLHRTPPLRFCVLSLRHTIKTWGTKVKCGKPNNCSLSFRKPILTAESKFPLRTDSASKRTSVASRVWRLVSHRSSRARFRFRRHSFNGLYRKIS